MKQYIKKYQDFLNEALTKKESEKYKAIQVRGYAKNLHTKIFGDNERIYLPFDSSIFDIPTKSDTQKEIEKVFETSDYEIISYSQNQCKKKNDKNITKIGKVLGNPKGLNRPDLAVEYGQDVEQSRGVKVVDDMYVCISRNSDDIASMSTDRAWDSCQNLRKNRFSSSLKKYVAIDLQEGSIIAYLIRNDDKEIKDPEARILLKPFHNTENTSDTVLLPCTKVYFRGLNSGEREKYPLFSKFVMAWAKTVQPDMEGTYKMNHSVYQDGQTIIRTEKRLTPEQMEIIENPKTLEDYQTAFKYLNLDYEENRFDIGDDGLVNYKGYIIFSNEDFRRIPKALKNIKSITGNLRIEECPNLRSLRGLENLERAEFINIDLKIKNLEGLDKVKELTGMTIESDVFESFNGLNSIKKIEEIYVESKKIVDMSAIKDCEIQKLKPTQINIEYNKKFVKGMKEILENPKTKDDFIKASRICGVAIELENLELLEDGFFEYDGDITNNYNPEFPEHFKKLKCITGDLDIRGKVSDFKNLETLETCDKLDVGYGKVESFEGLENLKIDFENVNINDSKLRLKFTKTNKYFGEILENPKSKEDFETTFKIYDISSNSVKLLDNGLYEIDDDIVVINETKPPKFLESVTYIDSLYFYDCTFENLEGLGNLEKIEALEFTRCKISNFKGLDKCKSIGAIRCDNDTEIGSFEGLENVEVAEIRPRKKYQEYLEFKNPDFKEILENPKSKEDFKKIFEYYDIYFDSKRFENGENGLFRYEESIYLYGRDFLELPKFLSKFERIYKLNIANCKNIKNLKGLENLKSIHKFDVGYTEIKDFRECENIMDIGELNVANCKKLKSYKGLENCKVGYIEPYRRRDKFREWQKSLKE